ncbi:LPS O-antigen chain length determinant protein WzzB [Enterovibrio norvegicus]|nr:Wzz/FepE/Etk N-terminal domain-containing protein [Enterovibrio norvegicus]
MTDNKMQGTQEGLEDHNLYTESDIFDFKKLSKSVWDGKVIILSTIFVLLLLSVFYALKSQEWWTSKATVTEPTLNSIVSFSQLVKSYQPAFNILDADSVLVSSGKELDDLIDTKYIFDRFLLSYNSTEQKRKFLSSSEIFKEMLSKNEDSEVKLDPLTIERWLGKISSETKENKISKTYIAYLEFEAYTAEESNLLLREYVDFTNRNVAEIVFNELFSIVEVKKNELQQQLSFDLNLVQRKVEKEISLSEVAYEIAKGANISRPVSNLQLNELQSIALGTDALAAKIETLKSLKDFTSFSPNLERVSSRLDILNRELPSFDNFQQLQLFTYLQSPTLPLNRSEPNRKLIVILGSIVGLLLGLCIVILRAFRTGFKENK